MKIQKKRLVLCGFGNVGRSFARLVAEKKQFIKDKYQLEIGLTAVVDIGGAAVADAGSLPELELISHFEDGGAVEAFESYGKPGKTLPDVVLDSNVDVLVETTPTNLVDGEPGKTHFLTAIDHGLDIVTANKAPLVLFYDEMLQRAGSQNCRIFMSAATAAALPTLDVGLLCLAGTEVTAIEGILNGTTNYILTRMHFEKCSYEKALKAAQEMGIAETDPTLDVEGLDTRNKILVITNQVMGESYGIEDVPVTGITGVSADDIERAAAEGKIIKLIGRGIKEAGKVSMTVEPMALDQDHPLAGIHYSEKGISYLTDTMGRVTVSGGKSSPQGAAAALLKDLIHVSLLAATA